MDLRKREIRGETLLHPLATQPARALTRQTMESRKEPH